MYFLFTKKLQKKAKGMVYWESISYDLKSCMGLVRLENLCNFVREK